MPLSYTVRCTFEGPHIADEWIAWLRDGHLAEVCAAGALDAEVIRLDGQPVVCEVRYHFEDRSVFEIYERDHAPRLRAKGLHRFPVERGLKYERSVGEVVARASA